MWTLLISVISLVTLLFLGLLSNLTIIMITFFVIFAIQKPIGANFDWKRVLSQVLEPISQNKEGYYQRYDWKKDSLAEWYTVPVGGTVIIEGVYSIRKELVNKYDFTIWVNCPRELRLLRGLERDGEESRELWENDWMIAEDIYVDVHKPFERADLIINGDI